MSVLHLPPSGKPTTGFSTRQSGFTLLEVMVALAILAVVAVSASQASRGYTQSVGQMTTRTQAYFVAQNTLADLRIQQTWPVPAEARQVEMGGAQWQVTLTPEDTQFDTVKKVTLAVTPLNASGTAPAKSSIVTLDAMLSQPTSATGNGGAR